MKHTHVFLAALVTTSVALHACAEKNEDITPTVNKNGAVETAVTIEHLDTLHDVLLTKHTVWLHGDPYKKIEYRDTVPALGIENTTAENEAGDTKTVQVKKDYEIFITVK